MPISTAFAQQPVGLDPWIAAILLLAALTLVGVNCLGFRMGSRARQDNTVVPERSKDGGQEAEAKSKAYLPENQSSNASSKARCFLHAYSGTDRSLRWTVEKTMRVLSSIVILLAAIYIIIFDREANTDRQKWAFGAVGLVFGHWAKR